MKYMIISDIHGGLDDLDTVLEIYSKIGCSKLIILGDLFNYGIDFNKDRIINRLNSMKDEIIAVCGNCDYNTTNILFEMPIIKNITLNNIPITLTHGHAYTKDYLSKLDSDIIFIGHSHVYDISKINNKLFVNPGSIHKSRRGENTFCILDNNVITIRDLNNNIILNHKF